MNKKTILVLMPIVLLACNFLSPAQVAPTQSVSQPGNNSPSTLTGFTVTRLHPADGELGSMLANEAQKAIALKQTPVVEFDATWCPPCKAIDAGLKSKNELMLKAYDDTYIIKLDVDEWKWDGKGIQGFLFEAIPVYFKLDAQGKQTGEHIDGGAWGEDIPENIAPVMDKFFHNK